MDSKEKINKRLESRREVKFKRNNRKYYRVFDIKERRYNPEKSSYIEKRRKIFSPKLQNKLAQRYWLDQLLAENGIQGRKWNPWRYKLNAKWNIGFIPKKGIKTNLKELFEKYKGTPITLMNIDIKKFFPSINEGLLRKAIKKLFYAAPSIITDVEHALEILLVKYEDRWGLVTGGPMSPILAITAIYHRLKIINQWIRNRKGRMLVYADDITIILPTKSKEKVLKLLEKIKERLDPLEIADEKTQIERTTMEALGQRVYNRRIMLLKLTDKVKLLKKTKDEEKAIGIEQFMKDIGIKIPGYWEAMKRKHKWLWQMKKGEGGKNPGFKPWMGEMKRKITNVVTKAVVSISALYWEYCAQIQKHEPCPRSVWIRSPWVKKDITPIADLDFSYENRELIYENWLSFIWNQNPMEQQLWLANNALGILTDMMREFRRTLDWGELETLGLKFENRFEKKSFPSLEKHILESLRLLLRALGHKIDRKDKKKSEESKTVIEKIAVSS